MEEDAKKVCNTCSNGSNGVIDQKPESQERMLDLPDPQMLLLFPFFKLGDTT
jgi:hypothetical protein